MVAVAGATVDADGLPPLRATDVSTVAVPVPEQLGYTTLQPLVIRWSPP